LTSAVPIEKHVENLFSTRVEVDPVAQATKFRGDLSPYGWRSAERRLGHISIGIHSLCGDVPRTCAEFAAPLGPSPVEISPRRPCRFPVRRGLLRAEITRRNARGRTQPDSILPGEISLDLVGKQRILSAMIEKIMLWLAMSSASACLVTLIATNPAAVPRAKDLPWLGGFVGFLFLSVVLYARSLRDEDSRRI